MNRTKALKHKPSPKGISGEKLAPLIFLSVGSVLLIAAVILTAFTIRSLTSERSTAGSVLEMVSRVDEHGLELYHPLVEFKLQDNSRVQVELDEGMSPPAYRVGQAVPIRYNPNRINEARILPEEAVPLVWIAPGISGGVGMLFVGVSFFVRWIIRKVGEATDAVK
jgi:hypothetical protein